MRDNTLTQIILVITAIAGITISCSGKPTVKNIESDAVLIDVVYADESFFEKYQTYDSFTKHEDYAHLIALIPNVPVKDFSWLSLSIDFDDRDEFVFGIDEVLYALEELHPHKPLVVSWVEVGMMSLFGFSYRDKDGQKKYFMGGVGNYGGDPEEYDGPAFWTAPFFPQEMVTGRYEYIDDATTLMLDLRETSYTLTISDRVYTGAADIYFADLWYVTLEGIRWAHNWIENFAHGNLDDIDPDTMIDEETYGLDLWWEKDDDALVFQNHGNPMAPYVIFDEIGDKYVFLKKGKQNPVMGQRYDSNLCTDEEEVLLSFKMMNSSKTASLCISKSPSDSIPDYIVYRYGTIDNIEQEFPENKAGSWNRFAREYHDPRGLEEDERFSLNNIIFEDGDYLYVMYREVGNINSGVETGIGMRIINNAENEIIDIEGIWDSQIGYIDDSNWYGNDFL